MLKMLIRLYPVVPIVLIIVTIFLAVNSRKKLNTYSECVGTIVDFYDNTNDFVNGSGNNIARSPVIVYSVDGIEYKFIGGYYSTSMKIGDDITLMYEKDHPEKAVIKSGLLFAPFITGLLGIAFALGIPIILILRAKGIIII